MRVAFLLPGLLVLTQVAIAATLPSITTSPTSQTVIPGANATFSVNATGAAAYQWRFNGTNIAGATTSSLVITNAQSTNSGYYMVVVKNAAAWVPSQMAYLSVVSTAGVVPFSNLGGYQAFYQDTWDSNHYSGPITNGTAVVVAGPALDQMQPITGSRSVNNGYYGTASTTRSIPTVGPGQTAYYRVDITYPATYLGPFTQPSAVISVVAGGNAYPTPSVASMRFPAYLEWPDPWGYAPPTNQLRVLGETFSLTNRFEGYADFGVPTFQWRKDGNLMDSPTNFFPLSPPYFYQSWPGFLTKTNVQPEDAGVYDMQILGNNWFITPKVYVSVLLTNGPGVLQFQGLTGSNVVLSLEGAPTRKYLLQYSTNLTTWSNLVTLSNATGTILFTNAVASGGGRFFRTMLIP